MPQQGETVEQVRVRLVQEGQALELLGSREIPVWELWVEVIEAIDRLQGVRRRLEALAREERDSRRQPWKAET